MGSKKAGDKQRRARGKYVKTKRAARRDELDRKLRDEFRLLRVFRVK